MPSRRQFLTAAGLTGAAVVCAACGSTDHPLPATGALTVTAGSVTNPTGSVGGKSLTGLTDATTRVQGSTEPINGTMAQWQLWSTLSDKAGVCGRVVNGLQTYLPGELTLRVVVTGYKETGSAPWMPPAADLPLTLPAVDPPAGYTVGSDGVKRMLRVYFTQAGKNGQPGRDTLATGGTVTFTAVSDTDPGKGQSADYDLTFGGDHATGSFVAPWCD